MKYTVYAEVSFDDIDEAKKYLNECEKNKDKSYKPTGSEGITVIRKCELWETHHDENPPQQCTKLDAVDFDDPTIKNH